VKSPGVPPHASVVVAARQRGIPVIGELELGWRLLPDSVFVAVTGTNGKTTVTQWIAHVLRLAGCDVAAAGNVGTALTSLVEAPPALVVCECSSYQLADTLAFAPEVGVLLNLGSDHLNWHGTLEHYHASKLQLFARQTPEHTAIAPNRLVVPGAARRVALEPDQRSGLAGAHNQVNAGAVAAACRAVGVEDAVIAEGLAGFGGVEHRLQELRTVGGVRFVNDSKATNVASALTALEATAPPVHLILGGDDAKGEDFAPLAGRAAHVYLVGAASDRLHAAVGGARCGDLATAVMRAAAVARPGETVLLSPACASFDQYEDYEARGRHFAALVEALA
jgi:UDP-N-acetylmuramoylalanine--D-glutamate ligase